MRILHICAGWQRTNGAAVIARLIADEQRAHGEEVCFATWATVRELRAADIVWVHCGWLPCLWWAALFAKRLIRMPEACYDPVRLAYHGWKKRLVGPIERFFLRRAAKVLATCVAEKEWILAYEPRANVEVIDIKRFFRTGNREEGTGNREEGTGNGEQGLQVLYLGRRHPLKGVEYLERAVAGMREEGRGKGIDLRIVSNATGEELEKVWEWCDVLVLPTLSENFGLVVAEALERGKRVVTTDGAPVWEGQPGVVYLKGYREGSDAKRVELLKSGLECLDGIDPIG